MTLATTYDLVMLDLDGVVYVGPDAVPGAAEALDGLAVAYLTNNAFRAAADVADHLRELGMPEGDVVTSAQAVARMIADELPVGSRVLTIGGPGLRGELAEVGMECVDEGPAAAVVQGHNPDTGWRQLAEASFAIHDGAVWFASNLDRTFPAPRGIAPGNGSMVQAVANATGKSPRVAGKPERALFDETVRRTGARKPLMVGDRIDTDIDGAIAAGIDSMVVLTGVTTLEELERLSPEHRPTYVAADLNGLHEDHPSVEIDGDEARCGPATATRRDGEIVVTGAASDSVPGLRARLSLAWATMDA